VEFEFSFAVTLSFARSLYLHRSISNEEIKIHWSCYARAAAATRIANFNELLHASP
jgi:hypothetical protein